MNLLVTAQVVVPVSLQYNSIITQKTTHFDLSYISFNESQNNFEFGAFPVYYYEVELPAKYFGCEIEIEAILSDTLSTSVSNILTDNDLVGFDYKYLISYLETTAQIYVLPFKWNISHDEIIKLTEFNLLIDFVPVVEQVSSPLKSRSYATESVLSSGRWIKMGITNTGVHKITYSDLENMGVSPSQLDVNKIGLFGNYNGVLPESNNLPCIDDLQENSIFVSGVEDGSFDVDDFILFYAQSATTWSYNPFMADFMHQNNIYADTTYYFFTPDMGTAKPISELDGVGLQPNRFVTTFSDYAVNENDTENLISSGRDWYGESFTIDTIEREFTFSFPNIYSNEPVKLKLELAARAFSNSYYDVYANNVLLSDSIKIRFVTTSGIYARSSSSSLTFNANDDIIKIKIVYYSDDPNAIAWLDYITLNVERNLIFDGAQMKFCNPNSSLLGNVSQFDVEKANGNNIVWDISDIHNPQKVIYSVGDNMISFTLPTDSLKTFVIFDNSNYYQPVSYEEVQNQNLHQITDVNFIIVHPNMFKEEAEILANIHREHDGLTTFCVSTQQIYNEFSSGSQDISSIRNFMKMLYNKGAFGDEHAYLLLFGDASFDYKYRVHENTNLVPTYEAHESLRLTSSFVTDDYYGLLDDNEGVGASGNLDIGIGRFPISTKEEAMSTINKIVSYINKDELVMRDWRTEICFVADDQDNNLHFNQAQGLVSIADTLHKGIAINKVYLDAYNKITVPGGNRYPDVSAKISQQIDNGALIINYTGHGGVLGWSKEHVLDVPMINGFDNYDNLPLIITATCEFSRFDDPEFTSAGEYFFLNKKGGAIALLTTTRPAYAHANYVVNRRIYTNLLQCEDGSKPRLGDLVRISKIPSHDNYLNFVLLGDPALRLAYPEHDVVTNTNVSNVVSVTDTIQALSVVNVSGEIHNYDGQLVSDFNGYLYPKVIDKATLYTTLGNDGSSFPADFYLFDKILFEGKTEIINGKFAFEFMVPKDIAYNYGYGKINYYALDTINLVDAWGAFDDMYIGGIDEDAVVDDIGPDIELYLNKDSFQSGDVVTSSPVLLSYISDDNGINSTGNGVGRDMVIVIDNDYSNSIIMNNYFYMDVNSYKSGKIVYPFNKLSKGSHTLMIKAWDLQNNSSEKTIEFIVDDNVEIHLTEVLNYPNPFENETRFEFAHNKNGSILEAIIRIYNIVGEFVIELPSNNFEGTNESGIIIWNGKNQNGEVVAPGIYVYTIEVKDSYGNVTVQQQKLFKINK